MEKLKQTDIRGPALYAGFREDLRKRIIELKRARRVQVGPDVTLVFENRATVLFQVEEMCRAESLVAPEKIQGEIDVYNALIPDTGQLSATLLVEITDEAQIEPKLSAMVGLHEHVWLRVENERISAEFDPDQFKVDRLAAVQYLRFTLSDAAQRTLRSPRAALSLVIDHPNYRHDAVLSEETRASLAQDLD